MRSVSRFLGVFVGTVVLAFGTWAASPMVTGHPEPWDAEYPFYSVLFLVGGSVLGAVSPRSPGACYLGAWLGQIAAVALLPDVDRSYLSLGLFTTAVGSLLALFGYGVGALLRMGVQTLGSALHRRPDPL